MDLKFTKNERHMEVEVIGRLDTTTAPQLEKELRAKLADITDLTLNFKNLDYISSAGLRVLLSTQKVMSRKGGMTICGANDNVMEVFEVTGFIDILDIQ